MPRSFPLRRIMLRKSQLYEWGGGWKGDRVRAHCLCLHHGNEQYVVAKRNKLEGGPQENLETHLAVMFIADW